MSHVLSPDGEISSVIIKLSIWIWNGICIGCGVLLLKYPNTVSLRFMKPVHLLYFLVSTGIGFCVAEGALRILGYEPWHAGDIGTEDIRVDGEMRYSVVDSSLGHTIMQGNITVTMPSGLRFSATHCDNRSRITHPTTREIHGPEIWTLGCSFTYGWAVDDTESYPWKLQDLTPGYEIVNFGISGYGTLQSLMRFQKNLRTMKPPHIVILGYVPWQEERNSLSRSWKKNLSAYRELSFMEHPFGSLDEDGELRIARAPIHYAGLPLIQKSAFLNLLDDFVNTIDLHRNGGYELTSAILDTFSMTARRAGSIPIIAFMMDDPVSRRLFNHCRERGIRSADISVDLSNPENSLLPLDPHPSARAHQEYAEKIYAFLVRESLIQINNETSLK